MTDFMAYLRMFGLPLVLFLAGRVFLIWATSRWDIPGVWLGSFSDLWVMLLSIAFMFRELRQKRK